MNSWGISGIILGIGFLICLFLILRSKWLQTRKNINDYQEGRDKLTFREPEEEQEPEEESGGFGIGNLIGGFIILFVGFTLLPTIAEAVACTNSPMNVTSAGCEALSSTGGGIIPLIGIFCVLGLVTAAVGIVASGTRRAGLI